jgi:hypothetical protein
VSIPTDKYLRNRPFLCITMIARAAKGVNTAKAGWKDMTGNIDNFESPSISDRVNASHLKNCNIIIDVMNQKVVKNCFPDAKEEEIVSHYLNKYREQVKQGMDIWLTNLARQKVAADKLAASKPAIQDGTYSLS